MTKLKITNKTSMWDVLKLAAKIAKGRDLINRFGARSVYGEAFHMIGITDNDLRKTMPSFDLLLLPGATEWGNDTPRLAMEIALSTWGKLTVGEARSFLRSQGASPRSWKLMQKET